VISTFTKEIREENLKRSLPVILSTQLNNIRNIMASNTIVLYTNESQECERVRQLLVSLGDQFLEYKLGEDFNTKDFASEFGANAEYPQVAIGDTHVGGLKDTLHYLQNQGDL
tara:strand:- start:1902 stop:2240 length:339 start_codon:yes stop_codon:yes gene_type:complete